MSVFSTGTSALLAFQRALGTVSHNVANVNTPGYSRQRVELEARPGLGGVGLVGQGVDVARLERLADNLVFGRQLDSTGEMGRLKQLSAFSSRLDTLVSDASTSMSGPWSAFFGAAEGLASEPTSSVARQAVIDAGEQLARRWQVLDSQFTRTAQDVDNSLETQVETANQLAGEIAQLNRDIINAGRNATPDLLDQRALRIEKLANLIGADTTTQEDGSINVFSGGQALVLGSRTSTLTTQRDPYRPDRLQVALESPSGPVALTAGTLRGEVGGLLEFRERVLEPARAELGRMAVTFAQTFNATQRAGVDYNGQPGVDMFSVPAPKTDAHSANNGNASFTGSVSDLGAFKGHDLVMRFDGVSWSAHRPDTGAPATITGNGSPGNPLRVDGVALVMSGTPSPGDRFLLRPASTAAATVSVAMSDPNGLAAASPLTTRVDSANLGNGRISNARVTDPAAFSGFSGATIEFTDPTQYTIDGAGPFPYTAGAAIGSGGWSVTLEGAPMAGDRFTLSATGSRSADNRNARDLAAVDDRRVLNGGTLSVTAGLSQLTSRVGSETSHAHLSLDAQEAIHAQVTAERESLSGVNLDEEAADLLRFQQAYQAAAQVIATADSLFQTLLGAVRR